MDTGTIDYRLRVAIYNVVDNAVFSFAYGGAVIIFFQALRRLALIRKRDGPNRPGGPKRLLTAVISIQLFILTVDICLNISDSIVQLSAWRSSGNLEQYTRFSTIRLSISNALIPLQALLADGIMSWRAWSLYPYNVSVKVALSIAMLLLTGFTLSFVSVQAYANVAKTKFATALNPLIGIQVFLNLAVNLLATGLIARIVWLHRGTFGASNKILASHRASPVSSVLWRLLETGALLCAIQFTVAILRVVYKQRDPSLPSYIVSMAFSKILIVFIAVHPALLALSPVIGDPTVQHSIPSSESPGLPARREAPISTLRFTPDGSGISNESGTWKNGIELSSKA